MTAPAAGAHDPPLRPDVAADRMVAEVRRRIPRLTPAQAAAAVADGALFVDLRPSEYRYRDGEVSGALFVPRHVLEWRLDPSSPDRLPQVTGHDTPIVLLCTEGYASSLAVEVCRTHLGLSAVADVIGGIVGWRAAGLPVVAAGPAGPAGSVGD